MACAGTFSMTELDSESMTQWRESLSVLSDIGVNSEKQEAILGKAYGWTESIYFRRKLRKELPTKDAVGCAIFDAEYCLQSLSRRDLLKGQSIHGFL